MESYEDEDVKSAGGTGPAAPSGDASGPAPRPPGQRIPEPDEASCPGSVTAPGPVAPPVSPPEPEVDPSPAADPYPPTRGIAALSLPYQVAAAVSLALIAVLAGVHLAMVFLHVAPSNTATKQYGKAVDGWVYPEFEQNWKLFAPNPLQQNIAVQVRAEVATSDGRPQDHRLDRSDRRGRRGHPRATFSPATPSRTSCAEPGTSTPTRTTTRTAPPVCAAGCPRATSAAWC